MRARLVLALVFSASLAACGGEATMDDEADADAIDLGAEDVQQDELSGCALDKSAETAELTHMNNKRAAAGLKKYAAQTCAQKVARAWALKMCKAGTLSHNPNLTKQIASACGPSWRSIGENVGTGPSEGSIFNAFWNSAPHRSNIMDHGFNHVGVGAYKASNGTLFITQDFTKY